MGSLEGYALAASERKREVLGTGAFTTVYAEWDLLLGHAVAIRELNSPWIENPAFVRAFLARAQRLFDVDNQHVLAVHRVDGSRQRPAVIRELAEETLEASLQARPLPPTQVEEILRQALLGLQAMHGRGVVHGAVKPQNLFRCGGRIKVGDFGVSSVPGVASAPVNRYAAPEVLRGEPPRPESDFYSLGLVIQELLLGKGRSEALAGLPVALSTALQEMTKEDPSERPASAEKILAWLGTSRSPELRPARASFMDDRFRPAPAQPAFDTQKLKRTLAISLGGLLLALTASGLFYLWRQRPSEQAAPPPVAAQVEPSPVVPEKPTKTARQQPSPVSPLDTKPRQQLKALPPSDTAPRRLEARDVIQASGHSLGTLRSGENPYTDLDAAFADVPAQHENLPCIKTADGDGSKKENWSFGLKLEAEVYVGHDRGIKTKPSWLKKNFSRTGETWSLLLRNPDGSAGPVKSFEVFARSYSAGPVNLGPNLASGRATLRKIGTMIGKDEVKMYLVCVDGHDG